jgi:trans-aconitate methyltransferase
VDGGALARCRFRVLDRCPTPLSLCEAFGRRHGLNVTTEPYDLVGDAAENPADFVIFHSVLRFVPSEHHVEVVRKLLGWLKPGGRVIASTSIGRMSRPDRDWEAIRDQVRKGIAGGTLQVAMDPEDFVARLGSEGAGRINFPDSASLLQLFAAAGAEVEAMDDLSTRPTEVKRNRLIAVLSEKRA